jgi:hypothetical protein
MDTIVKGMLREGIDRGGRKREKEVSVSVHLKWWTL